MHHFEAVIEELDPQTAKEVSGKIIERIARCIALTILQEGREDAQSGLLLPGEHTQG